MSAIGVRSGSVTVGRRVVRSKAKAKSASKVLAVTVRRMIMFSVVAVASYFAMSMVGQVKMEQARKEGARAKLRLIEAERLTDDLAKKLSALSDETRLARWALANNFVKAAAMPSSEEAPKLVASR